MYFDRALWRLTQGLRGRIALAILIGLIAAAFGIARFTLLGTMLARVFAGSGLLPIALAAAGGGGAACSPIGARSSLTAPPPRCRPSCAAGSTTTSPS